MKKMIRVLICLMVLFSISFCNPSKLSAQENQNYKRVYLSGKDAAVTVDWDFKVDDGRRNGEWSTIAVPSNWELQGFGTYNYGHDWRDDKKKLGKETGYYKYKFDVPEPWEGKNINIVFEASMTDTKVKVNGQSAGLMHQGGFYRFKYDITSLLKFGQENLLEVEVAKQSANESVNKAERQADFWIFGGIFRPVYLEVLPTLHFTRIAVNAKADGAFSAHLFLNKPAENSSAKVQLLSLSGKKIGDALSSEKVNDTTLVINGDFGDIQAWNPEEPVLYKAIFTLLNSSGTIYEKSERIGFRTVELKKHDGLYVNGKKVILKGVDRHSFRPSTGRALSDSDHREDIKLMKDMNMNAVRMSHYPPDERFLQLCDSLGLFVLDEVTGWQDGYDTIVGPKLIKETIFKDENHPSVIIWDNGNEGGWNFANEKWFHTYDFQDRPVIYPWLNRNGIDTRHYPDYNFAIDRLAKGDDVFMPTEILHGLYDGGHGAGLKDYWDSYTQNPRFAGMFLWSFADEAVVRTDKNGILDSDGNHAPDGILGPHHEKEGSFYTIKEIWSPVQIMPAVIDSSFNGNLFLKNNYIYTNLDQCSFEWKITSLTDFSKEKELYSGKVSGKDIAPGETRMLHLDLPNAFTEGAIFSFTAFGPDNKALYTWRWPIKNPAEVASKFLENKVDKNKNPIQIDEISDVLSAIANGITFKFDKKNGHLIGVTNRQNKSFSLSGGPFPVGMDHKVKDVSWETDAEGRFLLTAKYDAYPNEVQWKLFPNGQLRLEISPLTLSRNDIDFIGISFDYPEDQLEGINWVGDGPYRVWKNRMQGAEFGLWNKKYNNTATGSHYENLVYPEFKGYYSHLYGMELETIEGRFRIFTETPDLFLRLFTPAEPEGVSGGVYPPFPKGDISFLYEIPAIGTKFKQADALGPKSSKGHLHKKVKQRPGGAMRTSLSYCGLILVKNDGLNVACKGIDNGRILLKPEVIFDIKKGI